ncbi:MAG: hypothetical protein F4Y41_17030 [Gammaproteobacteria bacterium]|nr:hypothetical protein [Gammaproteobacteria bacterium]
MPERIYTWTGERALEALEETEFATEDELQALIAQHPELLDGEQIQPGNARRWVLIKREQGIAAAAGSGALWAVDHLIVDQDAVPTLVEVKRGSSPEVRRTIVGQMLEYAAHAAETWTVEELRDAFERGAREDGRDPGDELATLLGSDGEPDADGFWEDVATNLAARRLRLLFVADAIPDPLARVATFLNAQMPGIEVLAVEIKRFRGESVQTGVPGVSCRSAAASARGRSGRRLTRESFLDGFADADVRGVGARLLEAARESGGEEWYQASFGVSVRVKCSLRPQPVTVAWLYSQPGRKGWMRTRDFSFGSGILDEPGIPDELQAPLEAWTRVFATDGFAEDASSKGVKAWAVEHQAAVQHQDLLAERLRNVVRELADL